MGKRKPKRDIYQEVTDKIVAFVDAGNLPPWRMPILGRGQGGRGHPRNLASGKPYRGINVFLLAISAWLEGYTSDYWLTFKQAREQGGAVKKGEKSSLVVFWKEWTVEDKDSGEEKKLPVLRHYHLFNAEQCDGVTAPDSANEPTEPLAYSPIASAEAIVSGYQNPPQIFEKGKRAVYIRGRDTIEIAPPELFVSAEERYSTLFHELGHSTGHERRLNRESEEDHAFGTPSYAKEELVAEFTAAYLCAHAGISPTTVENSAAYINGWRKRLADDKKLVVQAAGLAQRAADHILGVTFDVAAKPNTPASETPKQQRGCDFA